MKILRNKFFPMFNFSVYKILFSLPVVIIEILSLLGLIVTTIAVYLNYNTPNEFLLNFQYIILFFINLFLLLFIVLSTVKIFGDEIADGTFLLLISKPYSRFKIFLCKFIALFLLIIVFLVINYGVVALTAIILNSINSKPEVFNQILKTLLWLTIYSLFFTFVVLSGSIFVSLAFSAQFVLLILTIFSSMFLLGGLPFSLISKMYESSNRVLVMKGSADTGGYNIQMHIKNVIFLEDSIRNGKIKYPTLTKAIYDFYSENGFTNSDDDKRNKIRDFYLSLGLIKDNSDHSNNRTYENVNLSANIENRQIEATGKIEYKWKTPVISLEELKKEKGIIFQEVLELSQTYQKNINDHTFTRSKSDQYFTPGNPFIYPDDKVQFINDSTSGDPINLIAGNGQTFYGISDGSPADWVYNVTNPSTEEDENYLVREPLTNIVFMVLTRLDSEIRKILERSNNLNQNPMVNDANLRRYKSIESFYKILTYFNVFEHWNQLWTTIIGYPNLELDLNYTIMLDWEKYRNYLNSYQDFPLAFREDNTIDVKKINYFLDAKVIMIAYGTLAAVLFITSLVFIQRKDIT